MSWKRMLLTGALSAAIFSGSVGIGYGQGISYTVQSGDTFWIISQKYNVSIQELMTLNNANEKTVLLVGQQIMIPQVTEGQTIYSVQSGDTYWIISQKYGVDIQTLMKANNATEKTVLNIGDQVIIPLQTQQSQETIYTVQQGDTYWIISQKFGVDTRQLMTYNGAGEDGTLYVGQKIKIPQGGTANSPSTQTPVDTKPTVTYVNYTVQKGDDFWKIALKFGIPYAELLKTNNMSESTVLYIGNILKIPVHNVPVKSTPGEKYGEYLDWWTEAQYVLPIGTEFKIIDFYTSKSFMAKRTTGANHADVEPLTMNDTQMMKEIWGGNLDWNKRPVVIEVNGRKIAASASGMPHAGNDSAPGGVNTDWRSGDYGPGYNLDWIKNNGMDGHFDLHFLNSTTHNTGTIDTKHQENIKIAAGLK
ncbi:MAG: LysM peptidoglycan-binding domain-containing protein [Bacillota bacterium]